MASDQQRAMFLLFATTLRDALSCEDVRSELLAIFREAVTNFQVGTSSELLTPDQLCDQLQVSRSKLDGLNAAGIPHLRVGAVRRYILSEVVEWLKASEDAA